MKIRDKPTEPPCRNVFLYGPPKTGKTLAAVVSAPGPVLMLNADLPNATYLAHQKSPDGHLGEIELDRADRFAALKALKAIETAANKNDLGSAKTVVIDPVGELYGRLIRELSDNAISPDIRDYQAAGQHIERTCRALCECPTVNAVFTAHDHPMKDEATETVEVLPFTGSASNPSLGRKLMSMVDVIGYTARVEQEDGNVQYVAQLIPAKGRRGGDRFDVLGDFRPLDLSEWFAAMAAASHDAAGGDGPGNDSADEAQKEKE
jgi:hypothetical protein